MEHLDYDLEATSPPERRKRITLSDIAIMTIAVSSLAWIYLALFWSRNDKPIEVVIHLPTTVAITVVAPTQGLLRTPTATDTATPVPDPTSTHTAVPTDTPTHTPTYTPTDTPEPSATSTATSSPTHTPTVVVEPTPTPYGARIVLDRGVSVNIRKKPNIAARIVHVATVNSEWEVIARTHDGGWFKVKHRGGVAYMTTAYSSFMRGGWDSIDVLPEGEH